MRIIVFDDFFLQVEGTILMPVPSSYNDITQDPKIRDFIGIVWYDRDFFVPKSWNDGNKRVWLRFSAVSYAAQVVSILVTKHNVSFAVHLYK